MNNNKQQINNMIYGSMRSNLDNALETEGFVRRKRSFIYGRSVAAGYQYIEMTFDFTPEYEPKSILVLLPQIRLVYPDLNSCVYDIAGDVLKLSGSNDTTAIIQIQNTAPSSVRPSSWWPMYDIDEVDACLIAIREFLRTWTIPFLNAYKSIESIVTGYETNDELLPHDRRFFIFVVASYLMMKQPAKALDVLESKFGRPGARREYSRAYQQVRAVIESSQ